ncbi:MAG: type II toxin-antitoxin system RelE/ParE family toxin [Chitinivibrionia bacterium]|nr:type II toxin-antitoxin system RelE/ParE family toxin [Chitinivibrionia bacterium]
MSCQIFFIPEAQEDYNGLDGSIKKMVNKKIDNLAENPMLGLPLGNKDNANLTGFYKIYVAKKSVRIVYRVLPNRNVEIVEIWGIGKRDKMKIYKMIADRLRKKGL